jgi:multidrug resistance efflux pump
MGILLTLTYNAFIMVLFKVFKIPVNRRTVPTAIVGGIFIIGTLLSFMNYNHPYSGIGRQYFHSTPIIPAVKGIVVSVNVKPNTPVKTGDVLFKIDPVPFQNKVDSLTAQFNSLSIELERSTNLAKQSAASQREVDTLQGQVDSIQAQLADAEYNLKQSIVRAASDGFVSQLFIHPGLYVVSNPLRPAMVFIQADANIYISWFRQNNLMRLEVGNRAEVAFDGMPGVIFAAELVNAIPVMAEGELQATGSLYDMYSYVKPGRIPVIIKITDPKFSDYAEFIPGGAYAQTAIYSKHADWVILIREMLLRMSSWMNYIFPFR